MRRCLRSGLAPLVALVALVGSLPAPASAQEGEQAPLFAVVVRSTGDATEETARDLQEILIAAFSGRGRFRMIGKDELQVQGGFAKEADLVNCLIDEPCVTALRSRLNMSLLVLGKIDSSPTHHEFSIERFSDLPVPFTRVVKVKQQEGVDGLLDALYSIAEEMPLEDTTPPKEVVVVHTPPPADDPVDNPHGPRNPPPDLPPGRDPRPTQTEGGLGAPGYAAIGTGVISGASLGVAIYFNQKVLDAKETLNNEIAASEVRAGGAQGITRAGAKRLESTANDNATFANVFYGVAGGLAATTALLVFLEIVSPDEAPPATTLLPILTPDAAGASLQFGF